MRTISKKDLDLFKIAYIYIYKHKEDETEFYIKLVDERYGDIIFMNATITASYDYIIRSYSKNTLMSSVKRQLRNIGMSLLDDLIYPVFSEHECLQDHRRIT